MTDARVDGLAREALTSSTAVVNIAGLAREALLSAPTAATVAALAVEVLAQFQNAASLQLAVTEPPDQAALNVTVLDVLQLALAATEPPDHAAFSVTVFDVLHLALAATEPRDQAASFSIGATWPLNLHGLEPRDTASGAFSLLGPPQAMLDRPPAIPPVPSDLGTPRATLTRITTALNAVLRGSIGATIGVTLAPDAASSTFADSRIGPYTSVKLMPSSVNARNLLPSIWVETAKGVVTIHHASVPYTDLTFIVCLIG